MQAFGIGAAILEFTSAPPEAAATRLQRHPRLAAAVFGLDRDRASQRVEPEQRIRSRHERDFGNRYLRYQVPGHDIAKRLVLAHAVHVHGNSLRRAKQRRGSVAAIVDVWLERVLLVLIDMDAIEAPVEEISEIERSALLDIVGGGGLHRRGYLVEHEIGSSQRCSGDDIDSRRLRGERQDDDTRNRRAGLHFDQNRLGGETAAGNFQPVAAVGQMLKCELAASIGLKALIHASGQILQPSGGLHGCASFVLDLEVDFTGRLLRQQAHAKEEQSDFETGRAHLHIHKSPECAPCSEFFPTICTWGRV